MTLTEQYNCVSADIYNAEQRLKRDYTAEKNLEVEQLKVKRDRLANQIRQSGPSVRDIQADDCVLL